jgi:hypothetical protein
MSEGKPLTEYYLYQFGKITGTTLFKNEIPGTTLMHDEFLSFQTDSKQIWLHTKT